jgi:hypothetical protein
VFLTLECTKHSPDLAKELEGHKLSDSVVERLPTLCALSSGGKISYAEVSAFHNVVRGTLPLITLYIVVLILVVEMDMVER